MLRKLSLTVLLSMMIFMMTGCGGAGSYHTLTIQVRDKVTGEPIPFANINVYSTTDSGEAPPRGAIASTNTNGVAVVPVSDAYPTFFEVYAEDHFMRPLHYADAVSTGYLEGWRDCGNSMIDGRSIQMKIASPQEALALQRLPERTLPPGTEPRVLVLKPKKIDPETQEEIEKIEVDDLNTSTQTDQTPDIVEVGDQDTETVPDTTPTTTLEITETQRGGIPDDQTPIKPDRERTIFESDPTPVNSPTTENTPEPDQQDPPKDKILWTN